MASVCSDDVAAYVVVSRLGFEDWSGRCIHVVEWALQRCIFPRDAAGVDSHLSIFFCNRTPKMVAASQPHTSKRSEASAMWEVTANGQIGFSSIGDGWASAWKTTELRFFRLRCVDVERLHQACIQICEIHPVYNPGLKVNATLCRCWPTQCLGCGNRTGINCVSGTLLALAASRNMDILKKDRNGAYAIEEGVAKRLLRINTPLLATLTPDQARRHLTSIGLADDEYTVVPISKFGDPKRWRAERLTTERGERDEREECGELPLLAVEP